MGSSGGGDEVGGEWTRRLLTWCHPNVPYKIQSNQKKIHRSLLMGNCVEVNSRKYSLAVKNLTCALLLASRLGKCAVIVSRCLETNWDCRSH